MKSVEQIEREIAFMKEEKSIKEAYYHDLDGTDDEDMIDYLSDLYLEIYVLDAKIRLLNWALKG